MPTASSSPDNETRPTSRAHAGHELAANEVVVWQGQPSWFGTARLILRGDLILLYFVLLAIVGSISAIRSGRSLSSVAGVLPPALLVAGILAGLAFFIARTTHYIVTSHRVIIRFGAAIPRAVAIPLRQVASMSVAVRRNGRGDIVLQPKDGRALRFLKLWPHVRPFRFASPEPMLCDIADAGLVATRLARLLAQSRPDRAGAVDRHSESVAGLRAERRSASLT